MFEFLSSTSDRAIVSQLNRGDARAAVAIETAMLEHPEIGSTLRALNDALSETAETLQGRAAKLSEAGFIEEARTQVERAIAPAFNRAVDSQRRALATIERTAADLFTPRFPDGSEPATRAEQRMWARGLSLPKTLEAVKADPSLGAAIVEAGPAMSGLPGDVFDRIRGDVAVAQLADRIVADAVLRTPATADDPVGGKADIAAARAAAADRIDRLEDERMLLGRVPGVLANVITAVAVMSGESRQAAFERLSA